MSSDSDLLAFVGRGSALQSLQDPSFPPLPLRLCASLKDVLGTKSFCFLVHCNRCKTEIHGRPSLVWISARFELAQVNVIGSQLNLNLNTSED